MSVCVLGGINWDMVLSVAELPRPGETMLATGFAETAGGKALNQAIGAARYGAATTLLGALGKDAPGEALLAFLEDNRIDTSRIAVLDDAPTGRAHICLAANGANMIVVHSGANTRFDAHAVGEPAGTVFVTQFEAELDAIEALLRNPAARAGRKILNTAPALPEARDLLALADILVMNEVELETYSGVAVSADDLSATAATARRVARDDQSVVVTLGSAGCLIVEGDAFKHIPGRPVAAIDTIGAGDCFVGTLAAALDAGETLLEAARRANAAAAIAVGRSGAAAAMPTRAELDATL
jgi:ribokinase